MTGSDLDITIATLSLKQGQLSYRYRFCETSAQTLLFIHGLGESGLSFQEAFQESSLPGYNILVPDLLGVGQSSPAADSDDSFAAHVTCLLTLFDKFNISSVHLVGHSMGGDIGTLICHQIPERVRCFVNIEGNLTARISFIPFWLHLSHRKETRHR